METPGSCEGPDSMYVTLISSDGHKFIIKRELALLSSTIDAMLDGPGRVSEDETNIVNLKLIPSHILHKVCLYLTYKDAYTNSTSGIPEFVISEQYSIDLLMAANFLDC